MVLKQISGSSTRRWGKSPRRRSPAKKWRLGHAAALLFLLTGLLVLLYPFLADQVANHYAQQVLAAQERQVRRLPDPQLAAEKAKARAYDESLAGIALQDPFQPDSGYVLPTNYWQVLNLQQDGVMGSLVIPQIRVDLPIYHGVEESVLQKGVGHIEYSSTPFGGPSRHAYLSAHRGLPHARLFSDLDQLQTGSHFYIRILGEIHKYQVIGKKVIRPEDFGSTRPQPGKDLITLVTCTPYGQNTHRLLVTGQRLPYRGELAAKTNTGTSLSAPAQMRLYLPGLVLLGILGLRVLPFKAGRNRHACKSLFLYRRSGHRPGATHRTSLGNHGGKHL